MRERVSALMIGLAIIGSSALAQVGSQVVVTPGATVTTTVSTPTDDVTTRVTTNAGQSVVTQFKDGTPVELDSDGTVHVVYPDGARVSAPDGVHMLKDGTSVTVENGRRIP